jgi:hypothetical protein
MSNLTPISIDLTELRDEFSLLQSQIESLGGILVNEITDRVFNNWKNAAMQGLNSTRKAYINGLNIGEVNSTHKYIVLTGIWPNMLEEGFGAFDQKPGMLNSPKVQVTSKGVRFITIPFRQGTPSAIGESEVFANVMPKEIYDIVKKLKPTTTSTSGSKTSGGSLNYSSIPKEYQIPKSRVAFTDIKTQITYPEYKHKNPISEGMVRNEKTYEKSASGTYTTFRRISENSSPMSWIHRGVSAKNFSQQAVNNTDVSNISDRIIDMFLQQNNF